MFHQLMSLVGAGMILGAYVANQRGWLSPADRLYNALNVVGSALLAWIAIVDRRAGFIILEVAWALVSIPGLLRAKRWVTGQPA
jgi:hypothetical protein